MTHAEALTIQLRTALRLSHSAARRSRRILRAARPLVESPRWKCEWNSENRGGR